MSASKSSNRQSRSGNGEGAPDTSHATTTATTTTSTGSSRPQRAGSSKQNDQSSSQQLPDTSAYGNNTFETEESHLGQPQLRSGDNGGEDYSSKDAEATLRDLRSVYGEEKIAQARAVLAAAGYPTPFDDDLLSVLEQARHLHSVANHGDTERSFSGSRREREGSWEDVPVDASAPETAAERPASAGTLENRSSRQPPPQPYTRQTSQRPAWDASTRPLKAADDAEQQKREAHQRHQSAVAAAARNRHAGSADLPLALQAYASSSRVPADSPASLLQPSARLQRYVKYYERALRDSYRRHPDLLAGGNNLAAPRHVQPFPVRQAGAIITADGRPSQVLEMPLQRSYGLAPSAHPQGGGALATGGASPDGGAKVAPSQQPYAAQRRAANLIYDKTGDPRYRFNLLDPDPDIVSRCSDPSPSSSLCNRQQQQRLTSTPSASSALTASLGSSARLRRLDRQPQVFPREFNPRVADRQKGQVLTTYTIRYVDTDGSTLPQKADPVARGQQMRALWSRDSFLGRQAKQSPSLNVSAFREH